MALIAEISGALALHRTMNGPGILVCMFKKALGRGSPQLYDCCVNI